MNTQDYAQLLKIIINDETIARQNTLQSIFMQDEFAVAPLLNQFYAGVNEAMGLVIIYIIAEIGGFEAQSFLDELVALSQPYPSWQYAAQQGKSIN